MLNELSNGIAVRTARRKTLNPNRTEEQNRSLEKKITSTVESLKFQKYEDQVKIYTKTWNPN